MRDAVSQERESERENDIRREVEVVESRRDEEKEREWEWEGIKLEGSNLQCESFKHHNPEHLHGSVCIRGNMCFYMCVKNKYMRKKPDTCACLCAFRNRRVIKTRGTVAVTALLLWLLWLDGTLSLLVTFGHAKLILMQGCMCCETDRGRL